MGNRTPKRLIFICLQLQDQILAILTPVLLFSVGVCVFANSMTVCAFCNFQLIFYCQSNNNEIIGQVTPNATADSDSDSESDSPAECDCDGRASASVQHGENFKVGSSSPEF